MVTRIGICTFAVVLAAPFALAQTTREAAGAGPQSNVSGNMGAPRAMIFARIETHRPSDAVFETVYGSAMAFSAEARLRAARRIYIDLEAGYLKKAGALTLTRETTTLTIYPVTGMVVFYLAPGKVSPYVAAGGTGYKYSEQNFIGSVSDLGFGFAAAGGVTLHLGRRAAVDARVKYSSVKVRPSEDEANLGGLALGVGAGIRF
jgi:hypothetical protein